MTLNLDGQPFLLQLTMWACFIALIASALIAIYSIALGLSRTGVLTNKKEDLLLGRSERWAGKHDLFTTFLNADEFRSLRRLMISAWAAAIVSFLSLVFLIAIFGERAPH